jgi:hypothetical protein
VSLGGAGVGFGGKTTATTEARPGPFAAVCAVEAGVGSTDGVGEASGLLVGSPDAPGVGGDPVGRGTMDDGVAPGADGPDAVRVGAGETVAAPVVEPPAVAGGVDRPTMPNPRATPAMTRFTTPSARTRRRRCAAVTS